MHFNPNEKISEVTIRDIRKIFRRIKSGEMFVAEYISDCTGISELSAHNLAAILLQRGYIKKRPTVVMKGDWFELDNLGISLKNARFTKRFSHTTAFVMLDSLKERALTINKDKWLPHYIDEIRIFGSYLTESSDLGDLDLEANITNRYSASIAVDLSVLIAENFNVQTDLRQQLFGEMLLRRKLANRDGRIEIHKFGTAEELKTKWETVFNSTKVTRDPNPSTLVKRLSAKFRDPSAIQAPPIVQEVFEREMRRW